MGTIVKTTNKHINSTSEFLNALHVGVSELRGQRAEDAACKLLL